MEREGSVSPWHVRVYGRRWLVRRCGGGMIYIRVAGSVNSLEPLT